MAGVRNEAADRGRKRKRPRDSESLDDSVHTEDTRRRQRKSVRGKKTEVKQEQSGGEEAEQSGPLMPEYQDFRSIHSKRKVMAKKLVEKRKAKKAAQQGRKDERKRLGKDAPPKLVPKTIESMREPDATVRTGDEEEDAEVLMDEAGDEMASYFRKEVEPKVLVTTSEKATSAATHFAKDLSKLIPNAKFFLRKRVSIKGTVARAEERGFTDIIVVVEDRKQCTGMIMIHLPDGPTAYFRLSSAKATDMMRKKWEFFGQQRPEIILNNFSTKLGHRVARMLASLFHYDPEFRGRRVVTFHNQRDYIFFRQHRYEFKNDKKVALKELGPRFTLKLRWLQKGTFDTKRGEYEWIHRRGEMDTSRRRFHL